MKCKSEWQSPATEVRISTSRGPGFGRLTSSITSGLLTSNRTAAFIGVSSFCYRYSADFLHLSQGERSERINDAIRVRGYGLSLDCNPSPGLLRMSNRGHR